MPIIRRSICLWNLIVLFFAVPGTCFSQLRQTPTKLSLLRLAEYEKLDGEQRLNLKIDLDSTKVVNMEDINAGEKKVYCRCWLSGTFPNCDGSHVKHNKEFTDNVGPLIITAPQEKSQEAQTVDTKVDGRKRRLIAGYYSTGIAYVIYAMRALRIGKMQATAVLIAGGYTMAAGLAYILVSAVNGNRLKSDTYKRLNLVLLEFGLFGLIGWGILKFGQTSYGIPPLFLGPLFATINGIKGYGYGVLGVDKAKDSTSIVKDFGEGVVTTIRGYFAPPKTAIAIGYYAGTWTFAALKVMKLIEICKLLMDGESAFVVYTRLARFARLAMMSTILYTLKDAADRNRLEGTTFIELNYLSSVALATFANYSGVLTGVGGISAALSIFSLVNGISSTLKKKATTA